MKTDARRHTKSMFPMYREIHQILELYPKLVFSLGIGWYFTGILPTNTNRKLGWQILAYKIWWEPLFPSKREGLYPLFDALRPPFEEKMTFRGFFKKESREIFKKEVPPNLTVQNTTRNIPTIKQPVLVTYQYQPDG